MKKTVDNERKEWQRNKVIKYVKCKDGGDLNVQKYCGRKW